MSIDALTSRQLRHFVAAYDCRNLRKASEQVSVTQPALSKSIANLEGQLGVPLFNRVAQGVEPTAFAETLRQHARNMLNEARFVEAEINTLTQGSGGQIRIGVGPAWSLSLFPRALKALYRKFPNVEIEAQVGVYDHLVPRLQDGSIDIWLGSILQLDSLPLISVEYKGEVNMAVYVAQNHPLASQQRVSARDLSDYRWAGFIDDSQGFVQLGKWFEKQGLPPAQITHRNSSVIGMFAVAADSLLCVYAADSLQQEAELRGLTRLLLTEEIWRFRMGMAVRLAAEHLTVIQYLRQWLNNTHST